MSVQGNFAAPAAPAADFWRSSNGTLLPDGTTDTTDAILHQGLVALGAGAPAADPVASLDVFRGARSGTDGRVAGVTPLYVTGALPGFGTPVNPPATLSGGVEFRHSNQSQGIGIGFDGIYATGSNVDQPLNFMNRGAGQVSLYHQTLNGGFNYLNLFGPAIVANQGWQERHWAGGVQEFNILRRRSGLALPGGGTLGNEIFFQKRLEGGALHNSLALRNSLCGANTGRLEIGGNEVNDDKLVLWGVDLTTFYGLGIKPSTFASFVSANTGHFRWYQGACPGTQIMGLSGLGNLTIDPGGVNPGGFASPLIRFGSEASSEAISSQRTGAGPNLNGLTFFTASATRVVIKNNGRVNLSAASLPVFATDALAGAGGLVSGDLFRDALGIVHAKI